LSEHQSERFASLAGSRALVTGGAGFIGSHLVDGLIAAGVDRIHVLDDLSLGREANLESALEHPGVNLTVGDAADAELLDRICGSDGPFDHCFNLAVIPLPHSLVHPRENVDRNVAMTTAVCELGRAGGYRRLIQFSSSEVFGTAQAETMDERHPLHPHTPYAAAKAATDLIALSYTTTFDLEVVVVRPFNTYGERQNDGAYAGLIPVVVRAVLEANQITIDGDGEQTRDMTYVSDTVDGALLAAAAPEVSGESFNLGAGEDVSVNELVSLLLDALERPGHPVVHGPSRPGDVRRLLADMSFARDRLGYAPSVALAEGLRRTVSWYLERAATSEVR
jgi:UDP-glucose 4-epimerase